jgi:hypothetical protein
MDQQHFDGSAAKPIYARVRLTIPATETSLIATIAIGAIGRVGGAD